MNTKTTSTDLNPLTTIASDIRLLHQEAQEHADTALQLALQAGQLLIKAKVEVEHGGWIPFVESVGMSRTTAARYMRLANSQEVLEGKCATVAHLSIKEADQLLSKPKAKNAPQASQEPADSPAADAVSKDARIAELEAELEQLKAGPDTTMTEYVNRLEGLIPKTRWADLRRTNEYGIHSFQFMTITKAKNQVEAAIEKLNKKDQKAVIRGILEVLDYFDVIKNKLVADAIQVEKHHQETDPRNLNSELLELMNTINSTQVTRGVFRVVSSAVHTDKEGGDPDLSKRIGQLKVRAKKAGVI